MKIVFMGTPDFARGVLEKIVNSDGYEVTAVVTQPDKPKGRSKTPVMSPVKEYAVSKEIPVLQPEKIRNPEEIDKLRNIEADIFVVAAFGQILPKEILEMPKWGCINVHASLLPKYRGAAPIQWAIADGEKITGVTIMQMNEGLDTGDILTQREVKIGDDETGESLFDKLMEQGSDLLIETLGKIEAGDVFPTVQDDSKSSYAKMIKKEMGEIDFKKSAQSIDCIVRAFTPWPGGYTYYNDKLLKIKKCSVAEDNMISDVIENGGLSKCRPGEIVKVTKDEIFVACGEGVLLISYLQPEGKKAMSCHDFLLGNLVSVGTRLG